MKEGIAMKLTPKKNETELAVFLSGELNTLTAPELSALLNKELGGARKLLKDRNQHRISL